MKLGVNCILVAGLTLIGIFTFVYLPQFILEPLQWAGKHFDVPIAMAFGFIYTVLVWASLAGVVAWSMLILKPRNPVLYGLASAATFIVTGQSWYLVIHGNAYGYLRELVLVLTIPSLYWVFVRMVRKRHNKSLNTDAGSAGAG